MSGFRHSDRVCDINGRPYRLRLTMGALAEISTRLKVRGPLDLAQCLRALPSSSKRSRKLDVLLECLLRPCLPAADDAGLSETVKRADQRLVLPSIAAVFEVAFLNIEGANTNA